MLIELQNAELRTFLPVVASGFGIKFVTEIKSATFPDSVERMYMHWISMDIG